MSRIQQTSSLKKKKTMRHFIRKHLLILFCILCVYCLYSYFSIHEECDFYRNGECISCITNQDFPVGYKENCEKCEHKKAYYVEGGLVSAWLCLDETKEPPVTPDFEKDITPCPSSRPLKDIVGNCYSCNTEEPVHLLHAGKSLPCQDTRYILPDNLTLKSLKCPILEGIHDPEVCLSCHGIWSGQFCTNTGKNNLCKTNQDCPLNQWCFPLKIEVSEQGICTGQPETKWICSQTDGYDLAATQAFCTRQGAHIPTLEEIEHADENLTELCPTLDMWTFFAPDGAVWLESLTQEFLFTREGETDNLGGHHFYALCHKD